MHDAWWDVLKLASMKTHSRCSSLDFACINAALDWFSRDALTKLKASLCWTWKRSSFSLTISHQMLTLYSAPRLTSFSVCLFVLRSIASNFTRSEPPSGCFSPLSVHAFTFPLSSLPMSDVNSATPQQLYI